MNTMNRAPKTTEKRYTVTCGRCAGTGRFDRGTCFGCKGTGYSIAARKPHTQPTKLLVTYDNGSVNHVTVYARPAIALQIVERQIKCKGWTAVVSVDNETKLLNALKAVAPLLPEDTQEKVEALISEVEGR